MKKLVLFLMTIFSLNAFSQENDSTYEFYHMPIEVLDQEFFKQYKYLKPKVIKVYPYAAYAADVLDQIENDLQSIERRRKRNKHCKMSYKYLKNDFKYAMLDLYISEGKVLMNLIARETESTVFDIIKKYRGADNAMVFNVMGKMFEQDIKAPYVKKNNYVLEYIIKEIEEGKIKIESKPKLVTKTDFKAEEKRLKKLKKAYKAKQKAKKKLERKTKKGMRKAEKNSRD